MTSRILEDDASGSANGVAISRPIVVATDGAPQSDAALAMARTLAARLGAETAMVAAYQPFVMLAPEAQLIVDAGATATLRTDLEQRVRAQCTRVLGDDSSFAGACEGEPPRVISRAAAEQDAQLIVLGIGRHRIVDRVFGSETALKASRSSHVPILAVPSRALGALRRVIVAVDFSEHSLRAGQMALRLADDGAFVQLVHVVPHERLLVNAWISREEYDQFIRHQFTRLLGQLDAQRGIEIEPVTLTGDPAATLLDFASRAKADLIAVSSHGHGALSRFVLGSVTTSVLRGATCAVLVVPPEALDRRGADDSVAHTLRIARSRWADILDDFTRQNVGRRTRLEVDDPELGAQAQETDYPLLGVSYDPHDAHVAIMLGDVGAGAPHLSRSIGDVDAVELLTDAEGRDRALRMRHGAGQTLLTLPRP